MGDTTISWTDKTWNCLRGCSRVSEGCRNCYAEKIAARFSDPGGAFHGFADRDRKGSKWTGRVALIGDKLHEPLCWRAPKKVFVNSMSDVFHEALGNEEVAAMFGIMAMAPQHTFQVLTKRAKRMRAWFRWVSSALPRTASNGGYNATVARCFEIAQELAISGFELSDWVSEFYKVMHTVKWPLPNVWIGVSVENQDAADARIPELLETPAAVRFLSCEPLIGPVNLTAIGNFRGEPLSALEEIVGHVERPPISWVIAGAESGPGARRCDVEWLRSLRDQCEAAGVPYFLKQAEESFDLGKDRLLDIGDDDSISFGDGSKLKARRPGGNHVIELPYLDGVQHAAFPEVR